MKLLYDDSNKIWYWVKQQDNNSVLSPAFTNKEQAYEWKDTIRYIIEYEPQAIDVDSWDDLEDVFPVSDEYFTDDPQDIGLMQADMDGGNFVDNQATDNYDYWNDEMVEESEWRGANARLQEIIKQKHDSRLQAIMQQVVAEKEAKPGEKLTDDIEKLKKQFKKKE